MSRKIFAYVSSWSHGERASGLSLYQYHQENGALSLVRRLNDQTEFSVSTVDQERGILYILDESGNLPGFRTSGGGRLFAFRIDPVSGELEQISCVPTYCPNPSYVTVDLCKKYLVVSNHAGRACVTKLVRDAYGKIHLCLEYDDSVVELFALNEDGSVGELLDAVKHEGSGPDLKFQNNPHPHCAVMSPCGKFFTVCDKGNDGIYMYTIDRVRGRLIPAGPPSVCVPGSRPRFCAYHPTRPYLYNNNEGRAQVDAYQYDRYGHIELIGSFGIQTEGNRDLPGEWVQQDFRIDRNGKFLYSLVSSPALVAVYQVDQATGKLDLIQNMKLAGEGARGCALSPDGRFLLVACAKSGAVLTLAVGKDGLLTETDFAAAQPSAAFLSFYQSPM